MSISDSHHDDRYVVSEEDLNAFVDNQLDADARQRVRRAIRRHPELAQEACDLDQMKDWVQQAYAHPPMSQSRRLERQAPSGGWRRACVACLLVGGGAFIGWVANSNFLGESDPVGEFGGPNGTSMAAVSLNDAVAAVSNRVILHVGSSDHQTFDQALEVAEGMLRRAGKNGDFYLQVLANADGVDLLRREVTPYAQRIEALMQQYPNVEFTVCGQSLARLEREGKNVAVLPNVAVVDTAVTEVVRRMQRGWSYVRI